MALSTAEIQAVVGDLKPRLEGGKIERIDQPDKFKLIFRIRNGPAIYWLQFCAHPRYSRLHLLTSRPDETGPATGFCNVVRQHLTGRPVQGFRQVENDRVVILDSMERDALKRSHDVRLIAELIDVGSNLILVDEDDQVLGCLFTEDSERRKLYPGAQYDPLPPPPSRPEKASRNRFTNIESTDDDPLALSRAIQRAYVEREAEESIEELRERTREALEDHLGYLGDRLHSVRESLEEARGADELRKKGELLKIALPQMKKAGESVTVKDFFQEGQPEVEIELDPTLTPQENIQAYFKRYKKLKRAADTLEKRLENTEKLIDLFEDLRDRLDESSTTEEIESLKDRARKAGLTFPEDRPEPSEKKERPGGPRRFISRDGFEILVARNSSQNDELTFTIANGRDMWLHLRGHPGPHVIIRRPNEEQVPQGTLLDAAHLAIHYSKLRHTNFAEVACTQRKYVQKLAGAPDGRVSYSNARTLQVRLKNATIKRLLDSRAG